MISILTAGEMNTAGDLNPRLCKMYSTTYVNGRRFFCVRPKLEASTLQKKVSRHTLLIEKCLPDFPKQKLDLPLVVFDLIVD